MHVKHRVPKKSWRSAMLLLSVVSATAISQSAWAAPKLELVSQVSLVENNAGAVTVQGSYAYAGDGTTLKIFDVSNPAKPTVVGTSAPMPDSYIMEVVIKGNYAYVANARGGLRILDISNPQHPFEVGVYNTNQPNDGNDWTLWGVDVRDNYAYVADMASGLRIVDISNPAKPVEVSFVASHSLTHAVKLNGNFAYMVDWGGGLRIVDITNPKSPKEVSFVATRGITYGVAFSNDGKLAYIADYNGLRIVDISNPLSPKDISFYSTPGIAINVVADGNYVYMNSYSELKVLDVSNPQSPQQVNSYNAPVNSSGYGLGRHKLNNNLLYVPNGNLGLLILSTGITTSTSCISEYKPTERTVILKAVDLPLVNDITGKETGEFITCSAELNLLHGAMDFILNPQKFVCESTTNLGNSLHARYHSADNKLNIPCVSVPTVLHLPPNITIPGPTEYFEAGLQLLPSDAQAGVFTLIDFKPMTP